MNFFSWDGKPLLAPDILSKVERNHVVELESGRGLRHPSRSDYEAALRARGRLGSAESLNVRPDLVAAAQAHWHAERCNSCIFSAYLSEERLDHGWETFVVLEAGPPTELALGIEEVLAPRLAAPATEIVSIIFPNLDDATQLAALVRCLAALRNWEALVIGVEEDEEEGSLVKIGLRRDVELDFVSEVLGFGPHPGAARTRLAPFTELAIRAKPPPRPKGHGRAVMADVKMPGVTGETMGQWGAETAELRSLMLGAGHDQRGKAKVSFVLPRAAWEGAAR